MVASPVQDPGSPLPRIDHFIIWPGAIPIAVAIVASTAASFSSLLGILAVPLGALVVCCWGISVVLAAGLAAWRRTWRRTASLLAMLVLAGPAMGLSFIVGDYLHLLLALPYYESEIATSGTDAKQISFHWPSAGFVPSYERYLVYDASDELAADVGKIEPLADEAAVKRTVRHLAGHFYLVEESW